MLSKILNMVNKFPSFLTFGMG